MRRTLEQRLLSRIEKQENGCWIWRGSTTGRYGKIGAAGYQLGTHRVAYELWVGEIPEGLSVMHTCNNPRCCNPAHLCVGTKQNAAKLRSCDAAEIKWLALNTHKTHATISKLYGVNKATVSDIKREVSWPGLEPIAPFTGTETP